MTDREIFKQNLKNMMEVTKTRQADLAKYAEVSYQTVSAWVCGRAYPRADAMEKLCRYFGIRQSELTENADAEETEEEKLVTIFRGLSEDGKTKMMERAKEMLMLYPMRK